MKTTIEGKRINMEHEKLNKLYKQDTKFMKLKFPFGQYKGLTIQKVKDVRYLRWYYQNVKGGDPNILYGVRYRIFELDEITAKQAKILNT